MVTLPGYGELVLYLDFVHAPAECCVSRSERAVDCALQLPSALCCVPEAANGQGLLALPGASVAFEGGSGVPEGAVTL